MATTALGNDNATKPSDIRLPGCDPLIGSVINGRFEVQSVIARGGMGTVYRGRQLPLGRACAVKVLRPSLESDERSDFHHRFFLEASTASKLSHPNTVTIFDYGRAESGHYFMAMEFLVGRTLRDAIRSDGPFPQERALHVARQICRSLREAHGMGVIHRDLKPANIFLMDHGDESDVVKVLDFGLVKNVVDGDCHTQTQAGICLGSPRYMAPEQIAGTPVDVRTDIYALGVLLFEMVTGHVPFERPSTMATLMAQLREEPPSLRSIHPAIAVSPELEEVISCCLSKSASGRFASMDELLHALKMMSAILLTGASDESGDVSRSAPGSTHWLPPAASVSLPLTTPPPSCEAPAKTNGRLRSVAFGAVVVSLACLAATTIVVRSSTRTALAGAESAGVESALLRLGPAPAATVGPAAPLTTHISFAPAAAPIPRVRVASDPAGATVKEGGVEVCAATPCDLTFDTDALTGPVEHRITVVLPGYRPESRVVRGGSTTGDAVMVRLSRSTSNRTPRPSAAPEDVNAPDEPTGGYKVDVPY